ncbi:fumarylacetoacetate hydrolase family protein [Haloferax massiliensis]|uniref:Fumarylacetoacetate (FAA) hydrolase family protein n=1 Tax=Haloferax massiliensis TaxID=1476858 RepID=A0A0D6JV60_9EURY|nr:MULTISPECIES: fumarylacetoacetate hydrolase family protein [Haloferax]MDS0241406.1 fumarylacetoacetate hydrolase family protein [Haloferax sp. S2CR25]MDS0444527.1 fumarylacetoacetate hydrolase family protein [Haloferax sp. S2CR25-2]CQR52163.1 Fumarylacetoacetate (FAA) hydrolase family protein [Haloferax massiliensis]
MEYHQLEVSRERRRRPSDVRGRGSGGESLPQAKVYHRCCSIGPSVVTSEGVDGPHGLATNTSEMVRGCEELVSYVTRHNAVPELAVILTGTSLDPEQPFDLQAGDRADITVEGVGALSNSVITV